MQIETVLVFVCLPCPGRVCVCVCRFFPSARRRWLHSLYDVQGPRCIQVSCDIPSKPNISKWNARIHQNVIRYDGARIQQQRQATVTAARTTTARLPTRTVHSTHNSTIIPAILSGGLYRIHTSHIMSECFCVYAAFVVKRIFKLLWMYVRKVFVSFPQCFTLATCTHAAAILFRILWIKYQLHAWNCFDIYVHRVSSITLER